MVLEIVPSWDNISGNSRTLEDPDAAGQVKAKAEVIRRSEGDCGRTHWLLIKMVYPNNNNS